MGWALIIIFIVLQLAAAVIIRLLNQRFHIDERVPARGSRAPLTFMIWFVTAFFNFFIALILAATYFD